MPDKDIDDGSGPNVGGNAGGYSRQPVPDPTVLTTQALYREVAALKELIEQRIEAERRLSLDQFRSVAERIDRAVAVRTALDEEIQQRTDLQFRLVEQQRVEQKKDTKDAVDAALTAQKEAVKEQTTASERAIAKSETATNKQLEQLGVAFKTETDALRRSIDDNKERIGDVERNLNASVASVAQTANAYGQQKQGGVDSRTTIAWGLAAVATIAAIVFGFVAALKP